MPASYYRARCLACHIGPRSLAKSHPGGSNGDCVDCHMPRRNAKDGGHTVFTDHRISRHPQPEPENETAPDGDLVAWRDPPPKLRERNLALAYADSGFEDRSASRIVRGYHMLTEVENEFPDDPAVLTALGRALLAIKQPLEAAMRFGRVLELGPDSAVDEANAGMAWKDAGDMEKATSHLEKAVNLDPLLFPAAEALMQIYQEHGDEGKAAALSGRVQEALGTSAPRESSSQER
jgi:tetratricopeptide (TPR) repeat protein